jgi:hypothetical protein
MYAHYKHASTKSMHFYLQGLWLRLLRLGATEDPLSSFEYGTILGIMKFQFTICLYLPYTPCNMFLKFILQP